jgi:hypothetical protein
MRQHILSPEHPRLLNVLHLLVFEHRWRGTLKCTVASKLAPAGFCRMTLAVMLTRSEPTPANGQLARRDRGLANGAVAACWVSERTTAFDCLNRQTRST